MSRSNGKPMEERSVFDPDPNILDQEWVEQPGFFHGYACKLADAKKEASEAKAAFDLVEAEVGLEIRGNPEKHGLEKVTEPGVTTATVRHKRYQKAQQDMINARHAVDILEAAVSALGHRKAALEDLVKLRLADYFSSPSVKDDREAAERMDEATKRNIRKRASK